MVGMTPSDGRTMKAPDDEHPAGVAILASGAGEVAWNGYYKEKSGGVFCKLDSAAHQLYRDPGGRWVCVVGGVYAYFNSKSGQNRPPATGWEVQRGTAPAPKLKWLATKSSEKAAAAGNQSNAAARRKERELRKVNEAMLTQYGGQPSAGKAGAADQQLAMLQQQWMPVVKAGEVLEAAGDLSAAMAKYQEAMDGFRAAGVKRPKLKQKMDAVRLKLQ